MKPCEDCVNRLRVRNPYRNSGDLRSDFGSRWCDRHLEELGRNVILPLAQSYADWMDWRGNSEELSWDFPENLNLIYRDMEASGLGFVFESYRRGSSRVEVDSSSILEVIERAISASSLDQEHEGTMEEHLFATLSNTGTLHPFTHHLDLVRIAQDNPEILWSHYHGTTESRLLSLALKIPQVPLPDSMVNVRLMEWRTSYLVTRFYEGDGEPLKQMVHLIDADGVILVHSDWDVFKYISSPTRPEVSSGHLSTALFQWMDFISREKGRETSASDTVRIMGTEYQGFIRPQSVRTLSKRVRAQLTGEISDKDIRAGVRGLSISLAEANLSPDPERNFETLLNFKLNAGRIIRWKRHVEYDLVYEGTKVTTFEEAKEWHTQIKKELMYSPESREKVASQFPEVRNARTMNVDELTNLLARKHAMAGTPLEWVLSTL